jgi:hypothetical protein
VYYGEHYVVDIFAGWALAALVMAACTSWERHGAVHRAAVAASSTILGAASPTVVPMQRGGGESASAGSVITLDTVADGSRDWRERTRPWLAWLRTLPPLVVPCVVVVALVVVLMASPWVAVPTALLLAAFLTWLATLTWERAGDAEHVFRVVATVVCLALAALRLL